MNRHSGILAAHRKRLLPFFFKNERTNANGGLRREVNRRVNIYSQYLNFQ